MATKLIVLAAGKGSRLGGLTAEKPKCLVEYQGRTLLDYTLETAEAVGIKDVLVVGGYRAECLRDERYRLLLNPDFETTNMVATLFCAEEELAGDIIISYADIIYRRNILQGLMSEESPISVAVDLNWLDLWSQRMEDPLADAETMKTDEEGFIVELGKKPKSLEEVNGQYMGLIKVSASAWPKIRQFYSQLDREQLYDGQAFAQMYMTSFLQLIIDRLMPIKAHFVRGGWMEFDAPSDLKLPSAL